MNIIKYPDEQSADKALESGEPMMAVISFDGKTAVLSQIDEAVEHHILLMKAGYKDTDIDRFFRVIFDKDGADWTFVCPPDYKNIPFKDKRIGAFYKDGLRCIGELFEELGLILDITIPKRYKRHLDVMNNETY